MEIEKTSLRNLGPRKICPSPQTRRQVSATDYIIVLHFFLVGNKKIFDWFDLITKNIWNLARNLMATDTYNLWTQA